MKMNMFYSYVQFYFSISKWGHLCLWSSLYLNAPLKSISILSIFIQCSPFTNEEKEDLGMWEGDATQGPGNSESLLSQLRKALCPIYRAQAGKQRSSSNELEVWSRQKAWSLSVS